MATPDPLDQALALYNQGQLAQAEGLLRRAVARDARNPRAAYLMGLVQHGLGRPEAAAYHAARAAKLDPANIDAHSLEGMCLVAMGRAAEGLACFDRVVMLAPRNPAGHNSRGLALLALGRPYSAAASFHAAIRCFPTPSHAGSDYITNLVLVLNQLGRAEEALELLRPVIAQRPRELGPRLAYAAMSMYSARLSAAKVLEAHRAIGALVRESAPRPSPTLIDAAARSAAAPARRLRLGIFSPDLRAHSVACFLLPLVERLDRSRFEVFCYHLSPASDEVTASFKAAADAWRDAPAWSDEQIDHRVRADRIDVLLELGGHTSGNRLWALRSRPAAVQMNYLGYAATTGVPWIDDRIVDAATDPPGTEREATEHLLRLPGCFVCYRPPEDAPAVAPRPADAPIAFGSFNSAAKLSETTVELWSSVLRAAPGARLVLKAQALGEPEARRRFVSLFESHGVEPSRLEFLEFTRTRSEHLAQYAHIDIGLDPIPYNGATTTCEALHMGVPVVTLRGATHAGRVGASLLAAAGLPELIADSREDYIARATALADRERLAVFRGAARARLAASALRDESGFAERFGAAILAAFQARLPGPSRDADRL